MCETPPRKNGLMVTSVKALVFTLQPEECRIVLLFTAAYFLLRTFYPVSGFGQNVRRSPLALSLIERIISAS